MRRRTLCAALLTFLLTLAFAVPAQAAYVAGTNYFGARWQTSTVCVEDRTPSNGLRPVVKNAVYDWNYNTDAKVWYKLGPTACNAYGQRIYVVQGNYGKTGWVGKTDYSLHWGRTANGNSTWLYDTPVTVRLNTYYRNSLSGWDHIVTHELAHALGLGHANWTCDSVTSQRSGCSWRTQTTGKDRAWINALYAQ
jgi:hypothetical protein